MVPKFTTWSVDELRYALERMYEKPVSKERRPLAGSLATSISEQRQIPIERIYAGDDDDAVDARRSLCRQLMLHGWTPWRIAERLAMPWGLVAEACDADGPVEALEYQETLTRRARRYAWPTRSMALVIPAFPALALVPELRLPEMPRIATSLRLVEPYDAGHRGLGPQRAYHGTEDVEPAFGPMVIGTVPQVPAITREEAREAYPHLVTEAAMIDPRFARGIRIPDLQPDGPAYTYIDWDKAPRKPRKRPFVIDAKLPTKHRSKPLVASVQERAVTKIRKAKVSK